MRTQALFFTCVSALLLAGGCLMPPPTNPYYKKQLNNPSVSTPSDPVVQITARRPEKVTALSAQEVSESIGQDRWVALLIGISDYSQAKGLQKLGMTSLEGVPTHDVDLLADLLKNKYGFSTVRKLTDKQATRRGILQALHDLYKSTERDNVLVYFAGHGKLGTGDVGVWLPCDAQALVDGITSVEIKETLKNLPARRVLLVSDSCFAGSFLTRGMSAKPKDDREDIAASTSKAMSLALMRNQRPCREVISSGNLCPVPNKGEGMYQKNSPFAGALLSTLSSAQVGAVLSSVDIYVDIYHSIRQGQAENPNRVLPKQGTLPGHYGGEFFFVRQK